MLVGGSRAGWDRHARERGDAVGHTGGVSPFAVEALAEGVRALTRDPARAAVFCDIDGTLGPVVDRADDGLPAGGAEGFARVLEGLLRVAR